MHFNASLACALAVLVIGSSPVRAHDMYSHLLDGWGTPCCNNTDCRPAHFRITPRGVKMFVDRNWIRIPPDKLQYRILHGDSGETGGGHWCGSSDWGFDGSGNPDLYGVTRCAVLPPSFSLLGSTTK